MLLKKGNIIMFPTNEGEVIITSNEEEWLGYPKGTLVFNSNVNPSIHIVEPEEKCLKADGFTKLHLYLFIEDDVKIGDFILKERGNKIISQATESGTNNKLIACSDRVYGLPKFSKKFLMRYAEKTGINEVFIVFEETNDNIIPKVNKNGAISIHKAKDTFTGVEVATLLKAFMKDIYDNDKYQEGINWINEKI